MPGGPLPQSILFACTQNAVRSPMAEAIGRFLFGKRAYIASAGLKRGEPDGFAISVMDEIGMDISRHRPRTFEDLEDSNFDLIVTLSPEAHHKALDFTRSIAVDVEYWPTFDATAIHGSRNQKLEAYRSVREALLLRLKKRFDWRPSGGA